MSIRTRKLSGRSLVVLARPRPRRVQSSNGGGSTAPARAAARARPPTAPSSRLPRTATPTTRTASSSRPSRPSGRTSTTARAVIFQTSFGGSTTQAQNIVNGFPADIVRSVARPRRQLDPGRRTDHARLADATPTAASCRRPSWCSTSAPATQGDQQLERPDAARPADPDAGPGAERRRALEHRRRLRCVDARQRSRLREGQRRPTRRSCSTGIFRNVTVLDKSAQRLDQELRVGQRRRRDHLRERGLAAQAAGSRTRS